MTTSLTAKLTTNLDALAVQIARVMIGQEPAAQARIEKGLTLALFGDIRETDEMGVYLVPSECQQGTYYRATSWTCCCADARNRGNGCKHSRGIQIWSMARNEAAMEAHRQAWEQRRAARVEVVA